MTLRLRLEEFADYVEFAECRVPAGSSSGGQFARCGKAFSRMSAHPDDRRKPVPAFSLDLSEEDDAEAREITGKPGSRVEHVIRSAYEGDLGGGVRSVVTYLRPYVPTARNPEGRPNVEIRGNLLNEDGRKIGEFIRTIVRDDRTLVAKHDLLEINSQFRGQGIADRFNARALAVYEAMGVDRIVLDASMTHGGYAWARQGFRVYGTNEDRHGIIERLASGVRYNERTNKPEGYAVTHPEAVDKKELAALVRASAAGEDIQPIHIASVGESRRGDADSWFGKDLLIGSSWPGVYYLDARNPVTAAAVELDYADLRPAFRDGTEVAPLPDPEIVTFSTEEYACHSAACRPPTSGGTGGSRPGKLNARDITPANMPRDVGTIMKTMKGNGWTADRMLSKIYEARGYHAKPKLVSREEMTEMYDEGAIIGYRGIGYKGQRGGEKMARDLLEGEKHYPGRGVLGDGTYVASAAQEHVARAEAAGYGHNILRMALPKSVMENDHQDIRSIAMYANKIAWQLPDWDRHPSTNHMVDPMYRKNNSRQYDLAHAMVQQGRDVGMSDSDIGSILKDTGRVAALLGIDGYHEKAGKGGTGVPGVAFVVVLNRSTLTIDSTVYTDDGITPMRFVE